MNQRGFFKGNPRGKEGEKMDQELKRKTLVIGHRNPDTDSICSAVCYANLKVRAGLFRHGGACSGGGCTDAGKRH